MREGYSPHDILAGKSLFWYQVAITDTPLFIVFPKAESIITSNYRIWERGLWLSWQESCLSCTTPWVRPSAVHKIKRGGTWLSS